MFRVGDSVSWTHVGGNSMSLRQGVIESIEGVNAVVCKSGGLRETIALVRLRKPDQKSQLSEFAEAVVEANRR